MAEKYLYLVRMDVDDDKEAHFNDIYDNEHIPEISKVPGVGKITRAETATEGMPKYAAIYEMDRADLPSSPEWKAASDTGTWKDTVRPFTKNRSHAIYKIMEPGS